MRFQTAAKYCTQTKDETAVSLIVAVSPQELRKLGNHVVLVSFVGWLLAFSSCDRLACLG